LNANNAEKCSIENDLLTNTSCENWKKEQESTNLTEDFSKNEERKNNNFVIIIEEVSDYEKLRLKNIEEKKAFMKNSKLIEKVSSVKRGIQKWESEPTNGTVNPSQIRSIEKSKSVKSEPFKTRVMPKRCKRKPLKYRDGNSTNYFLIKEETKTCDNTNKTTAEKSLKYCDENSMDYDFIKEGTNSYENNEKTPIENNVKDFDSKFESGHAVNITNNQVGIEIQCLFCKVPLENQKGLDIHVNLVHERKKFESKPEMVVERSKFESENDMNFANNQVGIDFQCLFCKVPLENQNDLDIHVALVHERKKLFLCSLCPTTCVSKLELSRHITSVHKNDQTNIELSQCLLCPGPLTFYEIRHLKDHNSKIHK
jgi:hypothetical protein